MDSMPSVQGILRHLEATFRICSHGPRRACCLPAFPQTQALFQPRCCTWRAEQSYLQQPGICRLAGSAVRQPQLCCHTQQKPGRRTAFSVHHTMNCAARPTPSGSIRFVVEVLCSCIPMCDGSAPFECNGFAEWVQNHLPGKATKKGTSPGPPHRTAMVLFAHRDRQQLCQGAP